MSDIDAKEALKWEPIEAIVKIEQLPILAENMQATSEKIKAELEVALQLPFTKENKQILKNTRAKFNKMKDAFESERIAAKKEINKPYEEFEALYKPLILEPLKDADAKFKEGIDKMDSAEKAETEIAVRAFFDEYRDSKNLGWLKYEDANINATLSVSEKKLKEQAKVFIDKVDDDLIAVDRFDEHKAEILMEYKKCFNVGQAVGIVTDRHKEIEQAAIQTEQREQVQEVEEAIVSKVEDALQAPTVENTQPVIDNTIYKVSFRIMATKEQVKQLKEYFAEKGIEWQSL